ncbi:hypothetical protein [Actinomadura roseirufa]|uniref:hypothetical protein n=1 Tax=Actinomadura roseirufa TaxID=2094049 RepID=UPI00104181CA|nr:hypothetical protein [Actinomadura roseirufa]
MTGRPMIEGDERPMTTALPEQPIGAGELALATAELDRFPLPYAFALSQARMTGAARRAMAGTWRAFAEGVDAFVAGLGRSVPRMAEALRLPEHLVPLWEAAPEQQWALIARPDVIVDRGAPKIVDVNAGSTAGLFAVNDLLLRTHRDPRLLPCFAAAERPRFVMGRYADLLRRYLTREDDLIAISFYAWESEQPDHPDSGLWYYTALARELGRLGLTADLVHAEDLEETADGIVAHGRRVGLVLRIFLPDVGRPDEVAEYFRIVAATRRRGVTFLTSPWGEYLGTKATLAALSDERFTDGLPPGLAARLGRAIPWTRVLEERRTVWRGDSVDLPRWALEKREDLVLKPALGGRGKGVLIGRETGPAEWAAEIDEALADDGVPWLLQELVRPDHERVAYLDAEGRYTVMDAPAVYGAFVLDGEFAGALRRHGLHGERKLMINGPSGAIPSPVYWSDRD